MKKKMSNRDKTFWAVIIPVVILFFAFNTFPMIKGVTYSFTNDKGYVLKVHCAVFILCRIF